MTAPKIKILTKIDKVKAQAKNSFDTEKSKEMAKKLADLNEKDLEEQVKDLENQIAEAKKELEEIRLDEEQAYIVRFKRVKDKELSLIHI